MPKRKSPPNPFAGKSFGDLSKIAGQMIRNEYDYTGKDRSTHFMATEATRLMLHTFAAAEASNG